MGCLGALSGFGATSAVWDYLLQPLLFSRSERWKDITDADVAATENAYTRIQSDLAAKEAEATKSTATAKVGYITVVILSLMKRRNQAFCRGYSHQAVIVRPYSELALLRSDLH